MFEIYFKIGELYDLIGRTRNAQFKATENLVRHAENLSDDQFENVHLVIFDPKTDKERLIGTAYYGRHWLEFE